MALESLFAGPAAKALGDAVFPEAPELPNFANLLGSASQSLTSSQFLSLFQQAGGEAVTGAAGDTLPTDIANKFFGSPNKKNGKPYTFRDLAKANKGAAQKIGKNTFAITPTAQEVRGQLTSASQADIKAQEEIGNALAENPFFAQTFRNARGVFDDAGSLIAGGLGGQSLGADINVQKFLAAPVLKNMQLNAQSRVQGLLSGNPFLAAGAPQGLGAIAGQNLGAAAQKVGIGQFNTGLDADFTASRAGFLQGLVATGVGAASGGIGTGGPSGAI